MVTKSRCAFVHKLTEVADIGYAAIRILFYGSIQVVYVSLMVLTVMYFHGLGINGGLQSIVGIWQRLQIE
jgi:hypothetical protein